MQGPQFGQARWGRTRFLTTSTRAGLSTLFLFVVLVDDLAEVPDRPALIAISRRF